MTTITLEEAQVKLPELIDQLAAGGELLITRNAFPVAKLVPSTGETPQPVFGRGRGKVIIVSEDDDHLKDFEEYMPSGSASSFLRR
jgi:antitoxin (DNA-binding transcriptional repressor) of toxin-antitoxin stability system